ncbi:hypothetical protein COOONC_21154 [Cooperia oncophora]
MFTGEGDSRNLYQQLVVDRSLAVSDFFESKRSSLLSKSEDVRETAFSELVGNLRSFPDDFLSEQQVRLLLDFLLGNLETSAVIASYAIEGVHHLVLKSKNLPEAFETALVQTMFRDGNVQGWDLEKRLLQYDIMEWLLLHRLKEISVLGSDFVLSFIRSVGGERHPRCLPQVFRMFVMVVRSFSMGPLVEDMFELVACYFPVEFKQPSSDVPITQELLAQGCLRCLTAHPDFGPFCYMLMRRNSRDGLNAPVSRNTRPIEAAHVFRPEDIVDHLEPILGGIRATGLNPKYLEPFVLQAEMGLTERALSLLRCAASEGPAIRSTIYDRVIPWILMLVQGDVVNAKANRREVLEEGLRCLIIWTKEIHDNGCDDVLLRFESSLFASLEVAREIAPNEALAALYDCSAVYLRIDSLPVDILERIKNGALVSWNTMKSETVQYVCSTSCGIS